MPYSYSAAAENSGVLESTLRNRCDLGLVPLFSEHERGKHRRFNFADVVGLAVMDEIAARGLSLWEAAQITKAALSDLNEYCVSTGRDDPSAIETVGLRKRVLFLWTGADGRWQWRVLGNYGWRFFFANAGIGETDIPRSALIVYVGMIAKDVAERIRAFDAERKGKRR